MPTPVLIDTAPRITYLSMKYDGETHKWPERQHLRDRGMMHQAHSNAVFKNTAWGPSQGFGGNGCPLLPLSLWFRPILRVSGDHVYLGDE